MLMMSDDPHTKSHRQIAPSRHVTENKINVGIVDLMQRGFEALHLSRTFVKHNLDITSHIPLFDWKHGQYHILQQI